MDERSFLSAQYPSSKLLQWWFLGEEEVNEK